MQMEAILPTNGVLLMAIIIFSTKMVICVPAGIVGMGMSAIRRMVPAIGITLILHLMVHWKGPAGIQETAGPRRFGIAVWKMTFKRHLIIP